MHTQIYLRLYNDESGTPVSKQHAHLFAFFLPSQKDVSYRGSQCDGQDDYTDVQNRTGAVCHVCTLLVNSAVLLVIFSSV